MKALEPKTKVIDGHKVETTPFPARIAMLYKWELFGAFGSPIIDFIKGPLVDIITQWQASGRKLSIDNIDMSAFDSLNSALFSSTDPEKATNLIFKFCASTRVDDRELTEDGITELFTGDLSKLYKVFLFSLEVNYRDFLSLLGTTPPVEPKEKSQTIA